LFVGTLAVVIVVGLYKVVVSGDIRCAVVALDKRRDVRRGRWQAVGAWILLKAFASGCTALTGVEAVSNGVQGISEAGVPAARANIDGDHRDSDCAGWAG